MAKKPNVGSANHDTNFLWLNDNKINLVPELRIIIKDSQNIPIESFSELNKARNKNNVEIFVDFFVKTANTRIEDGESVAEYRLKARDSKEAYLHNKKEALTEHICKHLLTNATNSHKVSKELINNKTNEELECEVVKFLASDGDGTQKDKFTVKLRKKGASLGDDIEVSQENITLVPNFNLPRRVDEVINFSSPSKPPEPFWTWGKIISAFVVIGVIAALIFFYRKKIWSWIKREDKTKKKEQVEIF